MEELKVFVSSTVLDFHDLRGALRYWLKSLGYSVSMSEFADFPAEANKSTHEACFSAIDEANVFVLLVGRRAGAWKEFKKLSMTHAEYKHARELVLAGKLRRMLIFVRKEVWDIKHDRDAMEREFQRYACVDRETPASAGADNHGSTELNIHSLHGDIGENACYIFEFLKEICQEEQTRAAQEGADYPKANWVKPFSAFEEIIDGIGSAIDMRRSVRRQQLECLLIDELRQNLRRCPENKLLTELSTKVVPPDGYCGELNSTDLNRVMEFINRFRLPWSSTIIREALLSGEFLTLAPGAVSYDLTGLAKTLRDLLQRLDDFRYVQANGSFLDTVNGLAQIHSRCANRQVSNLTLKPKLAKQVHSCLTMLKNIRTCHLEALTALGHSAPCEPGSP